MPLLPDEDEEGPSSDRPEHDASDPLLVAAAEALEPTANLSPSPARPAASPTSEPGSPPLSAGTVIAGRYRLDERLGEGGMGEVWAAMHVITRRRVAMKFLKGSASMRPDLRQRLLREARATSVVKHPSVVEVLDVFEFDDGLPVLVMDLLTGETLGAKLAKGGVLAVRDVTSLLLPVVEAVEAAHAKGIVHRDLKPDNIFLSKGESGDVAVKVLDFGIAKLTAKVGDAAADSGALTGTGSVVGTPWYMAPEQCYGERDLDQRADVWALGVILYECLAGVRPVEGESMGQVLKRMLHEGIVPIEQRVSGVPPELSALIRRMLSHAREDRPRDLSEVHRMLSKLAVMPEPSVSRSLGSPRLPLIAFALLGLTTVGFGIAYFAGRDDRDAAVDRIAPPRDSAPPSARAAPTMSLVEAPAQVPSPALDAPATLTARAQVTSSPVRSETPHTNGPRASASRPSERSADGRALAGAAADAGSVAPASSAAAPSAATAQQPPRPKTPEGRLFEDVPF